jgi:competence protein ComEA
MKKGLQEKIVLGFLALLLVGGGFWRVVESGKHGSDLLEAGFSSRSDSGVTEASGELVVITIHLVGAVNNPGVYELPAGSRVYQLLEIAGGFSEDADQESINQARPLFDGEQIYVGSSNPIDCTLNTLPSEQKININQATLEELTTLPGIGDVRAGQIIAYREKNGFFTDPRELMDVSGIGEKTYENIADLITIY